jgi:hypothetical protein
MNISKPLVASQTAVLRTLLAVVLLAAVISGVHYLAPTLVSATIGDIFALVALLALLCAGYLITCPSCHLRLVFHAMRGGSSSNWLHWVMSVEECPRCGYRSKGDA